MIKVIPELETFLSEKNKLVFFDEIHQGAGANSNAQINFLNHYIFKGKKYLDFPFIMVTATFLKPLLKYQNINNDKTIIIQWTYDMMQGMKDIANEETQQLMINELKDNIDENFGKKQSETFKKLLLDYIDMGYSLYDLQNKYIEHPSLSIICPDLNDETKFSTLVQDNKQFLDEHNDLNISDILNVKKLKSGAFQRDGVQKLLEHIKKNVYENGPLIDQGFNVLNRRHTQLWFLPTTSKDGLPSEGQIEPLMRYLGEELLNNKYFKKNFCFLFIHSKKPKEENYSIYKTKIPWTGTEDVIELNIKNILNKKDASGCISFECLDTKTNTIECIRKEECEAYKNNKSLIILTGSSLRLGVSLPCVDLAIHMDPIKSSDTIYQSMFRVLTPNPNKKTGYFVDLLKTRLISFIYKYEDSINSTKNDNSISAKLSRARELVYSHNLNGIGYKDDTREYIDSYKNLINKLGFENKQTFSENLKKFNVLEKKTFDIFNNDNLFSDEIVNNFINKIKNIKFNEESKKRSPDDKSVKSDALKRGSQLLPTKNKLNQTLPPKPPDTLSKKQKEIIKKDRETISKYFLNLLALYILFLDDTEECDKSIVEQKLKEIGKIKKIVFNKTTKENYDFCLQENKILECYLQSWFKIELINNKDLKKKYKELKGDEKVEEKYKDKINYINNLLSTLNEIINIIKQNQNYFNELINIYCNIKSDFIMVKEYNKENQKNLTAYKHDENKSSPNCSNLFIKNEKILKIINDRLQVRQEEKKLYGEVFTPVELVCEMLDTLPKSVWSNKDLKWLDPANGIGNYPVVVYYKLMEGLKDKIKNEKERSKHIIENMLYMVELNPVNVRVCKKIFKMIDPSATPNIYQGSFFNSNKKDNYNENILRDFKINKNEINYIIGNPPYDSYGIHRKFILCSKELLDKKENSILFVTPTSWLSTQHDDFNKITKSFYVKFINSNKDIKTKYFPTIGSTFCYYLLELKNDINRNKNTIIFNNDNKTIINLNNFIMLPKDINSINLKLVSKIIKKDIKNNIPARDYFKDEELNDIKTDKYKFKNIKFKKNGILQYSFSSRQHPHYNKYKLLFHRSKSSEYPISENGKYGVGNQILYLLFDSENELKKADFLFNSKLIRYLFNILVDGQYRLEKGMLEHFDLNIVKTNIETDEDIYKYYGITKEEQNFIENVVSKQDKSPKNKTRKATREEENTKKSPKKITISKKNHPKYKKRNKKISIKQKSPPKGGHKTRRKNVKNKIKTTRKKKHIKKPKLTRKRKYKSKGFFNIF